MKYIQHRTSHISKFIFQSGEVYGPKNENETETCPEDIQNQLSELTEECDPACHQEEQNELDKEHRNKINKEIYFEKINKSFNDGLKAMEYILDGKDVKTIYSEIKDPSKAAEFLTRIREKRADVNEVRRYVHNPEHYMNLNGVKKEALKEIHNKLFYKYTQVFINAAMQAKNSIILEHGYEYFGDSEDIAEDDLHETVNDILKDKYGYLLSEFTEERDPVYHQEKQDKLDKEHISELTEERDPVCHQEEQNELDKEHRNKINKEIYFGKFNDSIHDGLGAMDYVLDGKDVKTIYSEIKDPSKAAEFLTRIREKHADVDTVRGYIDHIIYDPERYMNLNGVKGPVLQERHKKLVNKYTQVFINAYMQAKNSIILEHGYEYFGDSEDTAEDNLLETVNDILKNKYGYPPEKKEE